MTEFGPEKKPYESVPIFSPTPDFSKLKDAKSDAGLIPAILVDPKTREFVDVQYQTYWAYRLTSIDWMLDNYRLFVSRGNYPSLTSSRVKAVTQDCDNDTVLYGIDNTSSYRKVIKPSDDLSRLNYSVLQDDSGMNIVTEVILDAKTSVPLMVGFMNEQALETMQRKGLASFWSRSRKEPWTKGETSGNFLEVQDLQVNDQLTLLVYANPVGPVCHTGARSCFDELV